MKKQNDLKLRVIPPLNVLLKEPLIGSGKLSRRITVKPFKFKNGKMGNGKRIFLIQICFIQKIIIFLLPD